MTPSRGRFLAVAGLVASAALVLSACAGATGPAASSSPAPAAVATSEVATPLPATPEPEAAAPQGAEDAFRAWLAASRLPNADEACAGLSPELAARMIAELTQIGGVQVDTCEDMITTAAALYTATGQSAEVDVSVQAETSTDATLFVTYLASGDCGTVVMQRAAVDWIITEQSQECVG